MKQMTILSLLIVMALFAAVTTTAAVEGPPYMNYQGVLRDSGGNPLDGDYDMVFRYLGPSGVEIMVEEHLASGSGAVTVSGGLFNVALGTGTDSDGSGPGTYLSLYEVFRDHNEVYLEVQIGAETLAPPVRILSTAYALNSSHLEGLDSNRLLRSDTSDSFTFGTLGLDPGTTLQVDGTLNIAGAVNKATTAKVANFNADLFDDLDSSAFSMVGHGHSGGDISGPVAEADTLDGYDSAYFLDTSSVSQTKNGPLMVLADGTPGSTGIYARGTDTGGLFADSNNTGYAYAGVGDVGISAGGNDHGGFFDDLDDSGHAWVGHGDLGISGYGSTAGGYFKDFEDSGYAYLGYGDRGIHARGNEAGGYFWDNDGSGRAYVGYGDTGIHALGNGTGGYFEDTDSSAITYVAVNNIGIDARGSQAGGYFADSDSNSYTYAGYGNTGIEAQGALRGGYFKDVDGSGQASVGYGNVGIMSYGNTAGGFFNDTNSSGYAYVGYGDAGIEAYGDGTGGYFEDTNASATAYVAVQNIGIDARGTQAGGYFADSDGTGSAWLGYGDNGIEASGSNHGGYFSGTYRGGRFETTAYDTYAVVAYNDRGIIAHADYMGGYFNDQDDLGYANVAYGSYKIQGNGAVSFVQNHPYDDSRVIVYTAPEGDEVATYTRGTACLANGEARVPLGETFAWVTNPDVGLTAHVTPRSPDAVVYVESVSTDELVVRNVTGFPVDATFDYIVYGLRIGFEERAVLQPKKRESYIPSMTEDREILGQEPELRAYSALERFKGMQASVTDVDASSLDLSASRALRDAIHVYDATTDPPVSELLGHESGRRSGAIGPPGPSRPVSVADATGDTAAVPLAASDAGPVAVGDIATEEDRGESPIDLDRLFAVSEAVEPGDLLVLDPERPGMLVRAATAQDPGIVGIAADAPVEVDGELRVALVETLYATVKADAGYGEIRAGDLLTSSFTLGHAMRAAEIVPGTVIGKALEPLESGTGLIKVLVMPR